MTDVREYDFCVAVKTRVWLSEAAAAALKEHTSKREDPKGQTLKKLKRFAMSGFERFEGGDGSPVQYEWDGIFRVGFGGLFRLIGFYDAGKRDFIVMDTLKKRGQKLSQADRDRINTVAEVKASVDWRKLYDRRYR